VTVLTGCVRRDTLSGSGPALQRADGRARSGVLGRAEPVGHPAGQQSHPPRRAARVHRARRRQTAESHRQPHRNRRQQLILAPVWSPPALQLRTAR